MEKEQERLRREDFPNVSSYETYLDNIYRHKNLLATEVDSLQKRNDALFTALSTLTRIMERLTIIIQC